MTKFAYEALNNEKTVIAGTVEATDRSGAIEALNKQGLHPIILKAKDEELNLGAIFKRFVKPKVKSDALVVFTRQLSTMVGAGVPLLRALNSLKEHTQDKNLKKIALREFIEQDEKLKKELSNKALLKFIQRGAEIVERKYDRGRETKFEWE